MQAAFVLVCCFFFLLLLPVILYAVTYIYRLSCSLCGMHKPTMLTAAGVMLVTWVSVLVAESIMGKIVEFSCEQAGLPRWEAWIIFTFLFFPIDLVISSTIEAGLMGVKVGKGIEVWFVQRLIYLSILAFAAFVTVVIILVQN